MYGLFSGTSLKHQYVNFDIHCSVKGVFMSVIKRLEIETDVRERFYLL
mgnify:CR=1 FL=1